MKCCLLVALVVSQVAALTPPRPTCYLEDGYDFVDNDIGTFASNTSDNCCKECAKITACRAWSWSNHHGGTCWFKSKRGQVILKDGVQSALRLDAPREMCEVQENVDYENHDLGRVDGASVKDCCAACQNRHGCRAYSWSNYLGGSCFLKSDRGRVLYKEGVHSGQVFPTPYDDLTCPVRLNVDFVGNDIANARSPSADGCCEICHHTTDCYAYTWTNHNGGTCWLKNFRGNIVTKQGAVSGQLYSNPTYGCDVEQDVDYKGGDIAHELNTDPTACCSVCKVHHGCTAYTWSNYNGGTCWLKAGNYTPTPAKGLVSGKTRLY